MTASPFWSEQDVAVLDRFFLREGGPDHNMNATMLDGYLAAVVSGPQLIIPNEWMRWIWDTEHGQDDAGFKDQREAQTIMGLVMQQYNAINHAFTHDSDAYEPLIFERLLDGLPPVPVIDEWCIGYHQGMLLDMVGWTPLLLSQPALLSPVLRYGSEDGWKSLERNPPTVDEHRNVADRLRPMALEVHGFWLAQRTNNASAGHAPRLLQPIRREGPKTGRNDPCPCGSGRKYKHCHGAN